MITFNQFQTLENQIRVCDPNWSGFTGKDKDNVEPRDHYVYVFLDARKPGNYPYCEYSFDYEVFYVGKGKGERAYVSHSKRKNVLVSRIVKKCKDAGTPAKGRILQTGLTEEQAFRLEKHLITYIGRRCDGLGPLANFTKGGEGFSGPSPKAEAKRKRNWTKAMKARTPEQKKLTRKRHQESWTPERREAMGQTLSHALKGKRKSPESIAKRKALYATPEWKAEHSARMKSVFARMKEAGIPICRGIRKPMSEDTRRRMSEARSAYWERKRNEHNFSNA